MPAIDVDRDTAHQAAQRELDKPIYPKGSLTQRLQEWIHELLFRLLEKGSSVPGGWFTISVLITLLIVAIVIAIRIARRTIRTRHGADYQLFDTGQLSADQHRAIAEHLAAEGNWTTAIRHRLRAVARGLEETRIVDPAPGRTANELAHDAGAHLPHLASELSQAATAFNDVTYGERPGTPAGYQMIVDLDDHLRLRSAVGRPGPDQPATVDLWAPVR
ncbi:MAG TPA: DUF4129 domain-containing protein [Mycobacterium sp.]|uniref:DUF4129 domain-containing protein n=1 Tax=Mycobacterium sp. TaxID=1785 RepID=UPI002C8D9B8D|nr:DUF4129 domain-containing protein [Mycobacterium sp.]HME78801.1 DUF4129 domain-containing protein [Mycobacterium sp.]